MDELTEFLLQWGVNRCQYYAVSSMNSVLRYFNVLNTAWWLSITRSSFPAFAASSENLELLKAGIGYQEKQQMYPMYPLKTLITSAVKGIWLEHKWDLHCLPQANLVSPLSSCHCCRMVLWHVTKMIPRSLAPSEEDHHETLAECIVHGGSVRIRKNGMLCGEKTAEHSILSAILPWLCM